MKVLFNNYGTLIKYRYRLQVATGDELPVFFHGSTKQEYVHQ